MNYPDRIPDYVMQYYKSIPCAPLALLVDKNTFDYKTSVLKVVVTISSERVRSDCASLFFLNETRKNYGYQFITAVGTMQELQKHFSNELGGKRCRTPLGLLNTLDVYYSKVLKNYDFTLIVYSNPC